MVGDYTGEIIKIPSRRTRWGVIASAFLSLFTVASNAVGFATYGITASSKNEKIRKARSRAIKKHQERHIGWTKYYGTEKGMQERLDEVQKEVKKILERKRSSSTISKK